MYTKLISGIMCIGGTLTCPITRPPLLRVHVCMLLRNHASHGSTMIYTTFKYIYMYLIRVVFITL